MLHVLLDTLNENEVDRPSYSVAVLQCILFISHFVLSCMIINELYTHQLWIIFGCNISIFLLPFFVLYCLCIHSAVKHPDDDIVNNPGFAFMISGYLLSASRCDEIDNSMADYCHRLNSKYLFIKLCNYFITSILLLIPVCLSPLISIILILFDDDDQGFTICYFSQSVVVTLNTIIQIITLCLISDTSSILLILCIISVSVGIIELTMMAYICGLGLSSNDKYRYIVPNVIAIEFLLLLSMIFISFMNLSTFNGIQLILLSICLINIICPNFPFYKSYLINLYLNISISSSYFSYILNETDTHKRLDKMFCILLSIVSDPFNSDHSEYSLIKMQQTEKHLIKKQYEYLQLNVKQKTSLIHSNYSSIYKQIFYMLYSLSSFIALISPIIWIIWMGIHYEIRKMPQYIFTASVTIYYVLFLMILMIMNKKHHQKMSISSIKYAIMTYNKFKHQETRETFINIEALFERQPTIYLVLNQFQFDIGMIIIAFVFDVS